MSMQKKEVMKPAEWQGWVRHWGVETDSVTAPCYGEGKIFIVDLRERTVTGTGRVQGREEQVVD